MGQKVGKHDGDKGWKLYNEQRFEEAVEEWKKSLKRTHKILQRFSLHGQLAQTYYDLGKYREVLSEAGHQIDIANQQNDSNLKAEAYFNLARSNEKLSEFNKAITYCRHSLQYETNDPTLNGYVHLCLGRSYHGQSEFSKVLTSFENALIISRDKCDQVLRALACSGLGDMYTALNDHETGLIYHGKAVDITNGFDVSDISSRFQRLTAVQIAISYRKLGRYNEAMENCEDAMKVAMMYNDRPIQAKCLLNFADIHRKRGDLQRSNPRYESAYAIMVETGDRLGQIEVLAGMAKTALCTRDFHKAIELNDKIFLLANSIGNKLEMMKCHLRLEEVYAALKDPDGVYRHEVRSRQLVDEMELYCGVCGEIMGAKPDKITPLTCGHFIHGRCVVHISRGTLGRSSTRRPCPACRRRSSSNPAMYNT